MNAVEKRVILSLPGKSLPQCHFFCNKIPHDVTWDRTQSGAVESQQRNDE
jgi:hypothetical protein